VISLFFVVPSQLSFSVRPITPQYKLFWEYTSFLQQPLKIVWKVLDVESQYPKELGRSLGLSNDTFSLRIKNATSQNSGTYKCTLEEQRGENSLSSIVTLKVTGCAGIEDEKLKKHKAELFMLTCLGIFYLLLIFFTCVIFAQDGGTGPWDPFPTYSMCWHDGQVQVHLLFVSVSIPVNW
uniref:Uncharacterized protein n=1 Tax=Melopsittacus undulatus TaxID=13146 RepID=A0A8V5FRF1_MELUD